jgi:hypothetical protein
MILTVIHMISFQMCDVDTVGYYHELSCGIEHESISADGFSDVKLPIKRVLRLSRINNC